MHVTVIADDLTGATDTGVQFTRAGYRTAVAFHGAPLPPAGDLDAVAVDTDSRLLSPQRARERVREAGRTVRGARIVYKKLDSTLRGHVAAGLEAALDATGRSRAVVAPAFPGNGRTTRKGVQMVRGVPVHETDLAGDLRTPVREGYLPSLLAGGGLEPVGTLGVEVRSEEIRGALGDYRCTVADAEEDAHLRALVEAVPDPSEVLWAGSAGLAMALGEIYPGPRSVTPVPVDPARRVLTVVGSASEVARGQRLRLSELPGLVPVVLELPPAPGAVREAFECACAALERGEHVVLYPGGESGAGPDQAGRIVEALAKVTAGLSERGLLDALILTGGDTAAHVSRALGARGILLDGEVESGVPTGNLLGPRPYRVTTKAGGFGTPETLLYALHALVRKD